MAIGDQRGDVPRDHERTEGEASQPDTTARARAAFSGLSIPEQLILIGAALVWIGADLFGDLIFDDISVSFLTWSVALVAILAIWARRFTDIELPWRYPLLLTFLGYAGLVLGAREFLDDMTDSYSGGFLFRLALYIGAVLMGIGAFQVARTKSKDL